MSALCPCCFNVSAEPALSSYENLLSLDDVFIEKMLEGGATSEEIKSFLDDVDEYVGNFKETIYREELDGYFIYIILSIMQREENLSILVAFDTTCQEEITYMNENRRVPESFQTFMYVVMNRLIKVELSGDFDPGFDIDAFETVVDIESEKKEEVIDTPFDDISSIPWCVESVSSLYDLGVISPNEQGVFEPTRYILREEFLKMIVAAVLDTNNYYSEEYSPVTKDKWYHDYLASAAYYGLTDYIFEDNFEGEKYLTRQDMATITYRASKRAKIILPHKKYPTDFLDKDEISFFAVEAIAYLQQADIIGTLGNGYFEPEANITRAEAAVIVYKLYSLLEK